MLLLKYLKNLERELEMKKETYETPEIVVKIFSPDDIIETSGGRGTLNVMSRPTDGVGFGRLF